MYISLFITYIKKAESLLRAMKKNRAKNIKKIYIICLALKKKHLRISKKNKWNKFFDCLRLWPFGPMWTTGLTFHKKNWGMRCGYKNLVIVIYISWCYYLCENTFSYLWRSFCETFPSLNKRWPISVLLPLSTWPKI